MIWYVRHDETKYEARQYNGLRHSLRDLLQDGQSIPNGMRVNDWIVRPFGSARITMVPHHVFRRDYFCDSD